MTLDDFKKIARESKFDDKVGRYLHRKLPICLDVFKASVLDMDLGYYYDWKVNNYVIEELKDKAPQEISNEEINLYLLKYSDL